MGGESFFCSHCSMTMTGIEQYTQHMSGKKHLKKLKALGISPDEQGASNIQGTQGAESSTPAGQVKSEESQDIDAQDIIGEDGNCAEEADEESTTVDNSDPVGNAVKANLLGKLPTKKIAYGGRCEVCNVQYTSAVHETQHKAGSKHLKKIKAAEGFNQYLGANQLDAASVGSFFCSFCNVRVNSTQQMDQHKIGNSHKKKVARAQRDQDDDGPPAKKMFVPSSDNPRGEITPVPSPEVGNGSSF